MTVGSLGAVCDVSALADRVSFERARETIQRGELYLPSATYSWLARDKLISVRGKPLSYSLVSQFVRDRELLVIYLPELLDELSRRLLFQVEREIPLTDLRACMLAAHLEVPMLTFEEEPLKRFQEHLGARTLWLFEPHLDRQALERALALYRELTRDVGNLLGQSLNNGGDLENFVEEFRKMRAWDLRAATAAIKGLSNGRANAKELITRYVVWDMRPLLREYLEQHLVQLEVVRELCGCALLMFVGPR